MLPYTDEPISELRNLKFRVTCLRAKLKNLHLPTTSQVYDTWRHYCISGNDILAIVTNRLCRGGSVVSGGGKAQNLIGSIADCKIKSESASGVIRSQFPTSVVHEEKIVGG